MNILLINHYAGSPDMGMEFRPYYMAREWIKEGHRVFIIAGDYSHLRKNNPVVNRDFEKKNINQDDLISIGTIGLIKGIDSYNDTKKTKITTYAARCIENEILMYFRSNKKRKNNTHTHTKEFL